MPANPEASTLELKQLQRCINDLVSVIALPAVWTGAEPFKILSTSLDALLGMLRLEFVYARWKDPAAAAHSELTRVTKRTEPALRQQEIVETIQHLLGDDPQTWPAALRASIGGRVLSVVPMRLWVREEVGLIAAGSARADFPANTERLILSVAVNQVSIGFQEAMLLSEQKRTASELDRRVEERTAELAAANKQLKAEIADRELVEERLLREETELKRSEGHKTAILRSSLDCIIAIDHQGCITEFNPAAETTLGYRREQVLGKPLVEIIIPPSLRESHLAGFKRYLATGESRAQGRRLEMTALCADGREIPVELAITRIPVDGPPSFTGYLRDITERKQNEDSLREALAQVARSEERWRSVFENSAIGVALTDLSGRFIATNPVYQKMLGYSEEEFEKLSFLDIIGDKDPEANWNLVRELLDGKRRQFEIEKQYRRKNGSLVWVHNTVSLVPGTDRVPRFVMALSEDVTERKKTENALRDSERRFRLIVDGIAGLVATMTATGEVETVNRRSLEYFGETAVELKRWSIIDAIHPDDLARVVSSWRQSVETATPYDADHRLRRFDGVYRWFHARGLPLFDTENRVVRWYVLLTDINERKEAEEKLRRSEAFLAEGQHLARLGNFSWRVETDEIKWSEQLYEVFGVDPTVRVTLELIGSRVHPEDLHMFSDMIEKAQRGVSDYEYQHRLLMPDQSIKYLHLVAHAVRDPDGRLEYIGSVQDVTEQRLSDQALAKLQSEVARVSRITSLGALTASIAHEVNQPLSGIITNASTCLRMLSSDPPNIDGALETARRTIRDGTRASDVIARLRTLYSNKKLCPELMDLNEAAREVASLSLSELQGNRVILRQELAEDLPPVMGDRIQLQQVILNLMRNASEAMSAVHDRPREMIIRTECEEGDRVRFSVTDSGAGFEPQAESRLFEAFYTTKSDGMGVGLSVSRSIIESHQGQLWATHNDGPGAMFCFSIPTASGAAENSEGTGAV